MECKLEIIQYSVPRNRPMSDRQGREKSYFHIWSPFQMTCVLEESHGPRELALLSGKLPPSIECAKRPQTTEGGQNKNNSWWERMAQSPSMKRAACCTHTHTPTHCKLWDKRQSGWLTSESQRTRMSGSFPARNDFTGM